MYLQLHSHTQHTEQWSEHKPENNIKYMYNIIADRANHILRSGILTYLFKFLVEGGEMDGEGLGVSMAREEGTSPSEVGASSSVGAGGSPRAGGDAREKKMLVDNTSAMH